MGFPGSGNTMMRLLLEAATGATKTKFHWVDSANFPQTIQFFCNADNNGIEENCAKRSDEH